MVPLGVPHPVAAGRVWAQLLAKPRHHQLLAGPCRHADVRVRLESRGSHHRQVHQGRRRTQRHRPADSPDCLDPRVRHRAAAHHDGWGFTLSLFSGTGLLIPTIAVAALFATASYLFYYRAMAQIGAAKSMALNISYSAWAVVISIVFLRDTSLLNPVTILCTAAVLVFGILAAADYKELLGRE